MHDGMTEETIVRVTNGVAVGGISLPMWWPTLADASNIAALMVPILSILWLTIQIVRTIRNWNSKS